MGQPILVGHHSEKHARKDAAKIENGMRRAVKMWEQSKYWTDRAEGAIRAAKYKERPDVRARRIKTLESELRKVIASYTPLTTKERPEPMYIMQQSFHECYPSDGHLTPEQREAIPEKLHAWVGPAGRGGHWVAVESLERIKAASRRWEDHYINRIAYETAMLGEQIGADSHAERFDFQIGGKITVRRESAILTILKLNKKDGQLVSVSTNSRRWTRVVPVEDIEDYTAPEEGAAELVKAATKRQGPCNYPGPGFATCTKAQWKDIPSDYKSTIHVIEATDTTARHWVRWAIGTWLTLPSPTFTATDDTARYNYRHSYYPVFITDEKRKDPPTLDTTPPPAVPPIEHNDAAILANLERQIAFNQQREARAAEAAPFEAMKEAIKAGVQVVAVNQLFPTPRPIINQLIELADMSPDMIVLEPSAGTGRIVADLDVAPCNYIEAIEISPSLVTQMRAAAFTKAKIRCADFLECSADEIGHFDRVLMNPPFENGADVKHIQHAMTFLKPGGRLVAICANGPRQQEKLKPLADQWIDLPAGSFKDAGTMVNAAILVIDAAPDFEYEEAPLQDEPAQARPMLAQDAEEAQRLTYGGRRTDLLKSARTFDAGRLETSPLFAATMPKLF